MNESKYMQIIIWGLLPAIAIPISIGMFMFLMHNSRVPPEIIINVSLGCANLYTLVLCIIFGARLAKIREQQLLILSLFFVYISVIGVFGYGLNFIGIFIYLLFIGISFAIKQSKTKQNA
jgi:hypothetical protein